jgi:crossover junction endodeoxyribonuclease RuvC
MSGPSDPSARVIGLDLSLTSTGVSDGHRWADRVVPKSNGLERLRVIRETVRSHVQGADLVVVEGLAFAGFDGERALAGLWWIIRERLDAWGLPVAVVTPQQLKKYATGVGTSGKDQVLAAVINRWTGVEVRGNDEADALVLAAMGRDWLGLGHVVPREHRTVLTKVTWPELVVSTT